MSTDLTFLTNEEGKHLKDRFETLIKDTKLFDCLVGYFYTSGFHAIYNSLENTEKIRILIGISTDKKTYDLILSSEEYQQHTLPLSHAETKQIIENQIEKEYEESRDSGNIESQSNSAETPKPAWRKSQGNSRDF